MGKDGKAPQHEGQQVADITGGSQVAPISVSQTLFAVWRVCFVVSTSKLSRAGWTTSRLWISNFKDSAKLCKAASSIRAHAHLWRNTWLQGAFHWLARSQSKYPMGKPSKKEGNPQWICIQTLTQRSMMFQSIHQPDQTRLWATSMALACELFWRHLTCKTHPKSNFPWAN